MIAYRLTRNVRLRSPAARFLVGATGGARYRLTSARTRNYAINSSVLRLVRSLLR